jgi:nucleotidyltransferase/DNA polymerase involved in DNA repair
MVGPATAKVLYDNEIKTIRDLALSNKNKLKEIFGNS